MRLFVRTLAAMMLCCLAVACSTDPVVVDVITVGDPPITGDPAFGDTGVGDPHLGDPHLGDPHLGDPYLGDPYLGDPYLGDPYLGDPYLGDPPPGDPEPYAVVPLYSEDFEAYAVDGNPTDWVDYEGVYSDIVNDALFTVTTHDSLALSSSNEAVNVTSYYVGAGSSSWSSYELNGRMALTDTSGGVGVMINAQDPVTSHTMMRLRRFTGTEFHIVPENGNLTGGYRYTGVSPSADTWYRFRFQTEDAGAVTRYRAKVWLASSAEPFGWQARAYDSDPSRLTGGTIGVWHMNDGGKFWDDLVVLPLSAALRIDDVAATEGGDITFEVALDAPVAGDVSFDWVAVGNTATVVEDFTAAGGRAIIAQSATSVTVGVETLADARDEPMEHLFLVLGNPTGAVLVDDVGIGSIIDSAPTVTFLETFAAPLHRQPLLWTDFAAGFSSTTDDSGFVAGSGRLVSDSVEDNRASHFVGPGATAWSDYELSGRLLRTAASGGIGVAFYVQDPVSTHVMYRFRCHAAETFEITHNNAQITTGTQDTGVTMTEDVWFWFVVQVEDTGTATEIRAKVWGEGETEPLAWQAVASDESNPRLTAGTIGVTVDGGGEKMWDNFRVAPLP